MGLLGVGGEGEGTMASSLALFSFCSSVCQRVIHLIFCISGHMLLDLCICSAFLFILENYLCVQEPLLYICLRTELCLLYFSSSLSFCTDFLRFIFFLVEVLQNMKLLFTASLVVFNADCRTLGFSLLISFSYLTLLNFHN